MPAGILTAPLRPGILVCRHRETRYFFDVGASKDSYYSSTVTTVVYFCACSASFWTVRCLLPSFMPRLLIPIRPSKIVITILSFYESSSFSRCSRKPRGSASPSPLLCSCTASWPSSSSAFERRRMSQEQERMQILAANVVKYHKFGQIQSIVTRACQH